MCGCQGEDLGFNLPRREINGVEGGGSARDFGGNILLVFRGITESLSERFRDYFFEGQIPENRKSSSKCTLSMDFRQYYLSKMNISL